MSEAAKLFNQSGGAASGGKQDAVNGAAQMMMKLLVQSKMCFGLFSSFSPRTGWLTLAAQVRHVRHWRRRRRWRGAHVYVRSLR